MATVSTHKPAEFFLPMMIATIVGAALPARLLAAGAAATTKNACAECHTLPDLWSKDTLRLFVSKEGLSKDVHWQHGVQCRDCHGGDAASTEVNVAHSFQNGFRPLAQIRKACADCHQKQVLGIAEGVHAAVSRKEKPGSFGPLTCEDCHGKLAHHLLPVTDRDSPVFGVHQVQTCGGCHEGHRQTYAQSVHGRGLYQAGLVTTVAVCANCHEAHTIYWAADRRSSLNSVNVAATCGKCHHSIEQRLQESVHARAAAKLSKKPIAEARREPTCVSCHPGHAAAVSASLPARLQLDNACGNCHLAETTGFAIREHVVLTELGYVPAAACFDCHGNHDMLPPTAPRSRLSVENRAVTCGKCHAIALGSFTAFDPHVDYGNPQRNPTVYRVYTALMTVLIVTFGAFVAHCFGWFLRSLFDVMQNGRSKGLKAGAAAYMRFDRFHRVAHLLLWSAFMVLALTGLVLKYGHNTWARTIASGLGGFAATSFWHRLAGMVVLGCLVAFLVRLARHRPFRAQGRGLLGVVFGPDSPVPNFRDLKDLGCALLWFLGLWRKPTFERWTYWEKFDFWAVWANVVLLGTTGLMLWFPNLFCRFLPATAFEIAKVVHYAQALLATGFLFAVHIFNANLRPERFPADITMLTGLVSQEVLKLERPEFLHRLEREGRLDQFRSTAPARGRLWMFRLAALLLVAVSLTLLAAMVWAGLSE